MRANLKKVSALVLSLILVLSFITVNDVNAYAATKKVSSIKVTNLKKKTLTLNKGQKKTLNVKVTTIGKKTSKDFTVKSSNKKVATVKKSGKKVVITAKKDGKANITITSKADKKKKTVIKVTVKTPVKKVTMSSSNATVKLGTTLQLKATVSSDASNKKLTWTSSDTSVATVSSTGLVTAKKVGKATITATAQDGSGKKATCVVTVINPNSIAGVKVINSEIVEVTLAYSQKLSKANFAVHKKFFDRGNYLSSSEIDYVETSDNKTYVIYLKDRITYQDYVRVSISGLSGVNGKTTKETWFSDNKKAKTSEMCVELTCGTSYQKQISPEYMYGSFTFTNTTLPPGMKINKDMGGIYSNYIEIGGTPSKAGVYKTTFTCTDEMGTVETMNVTFLVGDENNIAAYAIPKYGITDAEGVYKSGNMSFSSIVEVNGGSGSYKYELVGQTEGFSINSSGYINATLEPGTYKVNIKVTDKNNENITTTTVWTVNIKKSLVIEGIVKDAAGQNVEYATMYFYNVDTNDKYIYESDFYVNADGTYKAVLPAGTYDVMIYCGNVMKYVGRRNITANQSNVNYTVPAYKISITSNNTVMTSFDYWYDSEGNRLGSGNILYLRAGTYSLKSEKSVFISDYTAVLNITVNKNATVTANVTAKQKQIATITVGQTIDVTLTNSETFFRFTPTVTGTYYFYSTSSYDTYGYVYSETGTRLKNDDDSGESSNFEISYEFKAGTTYYLAARRYSNSTPLSASVTVSTTTSD
ncbi:MAG: Ig-like domain-containing protein [Lachnospiraceae bacterium]|nr:Ig-like domain-containing protein [Lachnospiraceae bacterium]